MGGSDNGVPYFKDFCFQVYRRGSLTFANPHISSRGEIKPGTTRPIQEQSPCNPRADNKPVPYFVHAGTHTYFTNHMVTSLKFGSLLQDGPSYLGYQKRDPHVELYTQALHRFGKPGGGGGGGGGVPKIRTESPETLNQFFFNPAPKPKTKTSPTAHTHTHTKKKKQNKTHTHTPTHPHRQMQTKTGKTPKP